MGEGGAWDSGDYFEAGLGINGGKTQARGEALAKHGNLSSMTVLYIMEEALRRGEPATGERGLMAAFGPGFSAEMLPLEWA